MVVPENSALREELLAMEAEDLRVRAELLAQEALGDTYHPQMRQVHERNASRLKRIISEHGWPTRSLVGADGSHAAWRILQHAIGDPEFQRACVGPIEGAIANGEAPAAQLAFLVDRIRFFEGKPQVYGTQFHWDENGELSPWPIEDADRVDERRREAGLNLLSERTAEMREQAKREGEGPPRDAQDHKSKYEAWLREAGWRS